MITEHSVETLNNLENQMDAMGPEVMLHAMATVCVRKSQQAVRESDRDLWAKAAVLIHEVASRLEEL